jgi:hypothetical protein
MITCFNYSTYNSWNLKKRAPTGANGFQWLPNAFEWLPSGFRWLPNGFQCVTNSLGRITTSQVGRFRYLSDNTVTWPSAPTI